MDRKDFKVKASKIAKAYLTPEAMSLAGLALCYGGAVMTMTNKRRMEAIAKSYEVLNDEYKHRVVGHFGDQAQSARTVITILFTKETSPCWHSKELYNEALIRSVEVYCTNCMEKFGYICVSKIYNALGIPAPARSYLWAFDSKYCDSVKLNVLKVRLSGGRIGYRIKLFPNSTVMEILD